jgi:hypothetical protein
VQAPRSHAATTRACQETDPDSTPNASSAAASESSKARHRADPDDPPRCQLFAMRSFASTQAEAAMYAAEQTMCGRRANSGVCTRWAACRRIRGIDAKTEEELTKKEQAMSLGTILLIVLILMLVGVLPTWPHARSWGYGPSGILGVVLVIVIVLLLMGRI